VYTNPTALSWVTGAAAVFVGLGVFFLWLGYQYLDCVQLTTTHIVRRAAFGSGRAIGLDELVEVIDEGKKGIRFRSRYGERIRVEQEFLTPEFWSSLHVHLPTRWHSAFTGRPGFAVPPGLSASQRLLGHLATAGFVLVALSARHIDWQNFDARCLREAVTSVHRPVQTCVQRATAAHDAEWLASLLDSQADATRTDKRGNNPAHDAVRLGFPDGLTLLIKAGANPFESNNDGDSAFDLAFAAKDYESMRMILRDIKARESREDAEWMLERATKSGDSTFRKILTSELGTLLPAQGDPKAIAQYNGLLEQAVAALNKRDYGEAIARSNDAIAIDASKPAPFYWSGIAYREMKNWGQAKLRMQHAADLMPDSPDILLEQGILYFLTGDYDRADSLYTAAIRIEPEQWRLHAERALTRAEAGRTQAALEDASLACRHGLEMGCDIEQSLRRSLRD
jgi:tetratricopeptide (TPR) repeat protein